MSELAKRVESLEATVNALQADLTALQTRLGSQGEQKSARPGSTGVRTPARPVASARTPSAASHAAAIAKSGKKPSKTLPVILQVKSNEQKAEFEEEPIDPSRKGFYNVGNKKIHYVLPTEYAGQGGKTEPCASELKLEHIFGYNGRNARNNVFWSNQNNGEIIYNIAATGVVMNPATLEQRFFINHTEDILSLAVHPTRPLVATGQLDPKGSETPFVSIWDSTTMEVVKKITYHQRGIIALAFSPDGRYLVSVGNEDSHYLALWEWEAKPPRHGLRPARQR